MDIYDVFLCSLTNTHTHNSGGLDELLFRRRDQPISDEKKIELVRGIARGVFHLHKYNIVHRDLAARNILLTANGEPKISVFHLLSSISPHSQIFAHTHSNTNISLQLNRFTVEQETNHTTNQMNRDAYEELIDCLIV
jgi:serine/threonine protein kinase